MALELLLKTKRRFRAPAESVPLSKLALQSLDLANNDIRLPVSVQSLFQEAVGFSDLRKLDLSNNTIGNEGISVVAGALQYRSQLRSLLVANCGFDLEGGRSFFSSVGRNHSLEHLVVDHNDLSGSLNRQKVLKDMFFNNKTLAHVSLAHCNICETGAAQISRGLGFSNKLVGLNLADNNVGD